MCQRINVSLSLSGACLPAYLGRRSSACGPACLLICVPASLVACFPACRAACFPCWFACRAACLPVLSGRAACLPVCTGCACVPAYLRACLCAWGPAFLCVRALYLRSWRCACVPACWPACVPGDVVCFTTCLGSGRNSPSSSV